MKRAKQGTRVKQPKQAGKTKTVVQKYVNTIDQNARAYARLIADPCRAPLVYPTYSGGEGGYLIRAESFVTYGSGTETSGFVHWTPGFMNTTNSELLYATVTDPGGNIVGANVSPDSPGKGFMAANAASMRCVAACLKFTYAGAETSRSGRVHIGTTNGGFINAVAGTTRSVNRIASQLQTYGRTPAEGVECIWKPASGDQMYVNPQVAENVAVRDQKGSITCAWAGLPAGANVTIHYTAVYEWQPSSATSTPYGIANDSISRNMSNNTLDQVIDFLIRAGETFVRWNMVTGGSPVLSAISSAYGLMGSTPMRISKALR